MKEIEEMSLDERLKIVEKMLFQVFLTMNFCKHIEKSLPDSFDDQLYEGINNYFKKIHNIKEKDNE
jgi:hypothetical protein